jgi:hypothetical protein
VTATEKITFDELVNAAAVTVETDGDGDPDGDAIPDLVARLGRLGILSDPEEFGSPGRHPGEAALAGFALGLELAERVEAKVRAEYGD